MTLDDYTNENQRLRELLQETMVQNKRLSEKITELEAELEGLQNRFFKEIEERKLDTD